MATSKTAATPEVAAAPVTPASTVKVEEGTSTEAAKNVIVKPKAVSKDNYGNTIESA
jgi:hypothetical protein